MTSKTTLMDKILQILDRLMRLLSRSMIVLNILNFIAIFLIGLATNIVTGDKASIGWYVTLAGALIVGGTITIFQIKWLKIPSSVVNELRFREEAAMLRDENRRKDEIYNYLAQSVGSLNEQTCALTQNPQPGQEKNDSFCENDLADNIKGAIKPLIDNANSIFKCTKGKYTIGLYNDFYLIAPDWENVQYPIKEDVLQDQGVFLLKNDHSLEAIITKSILTDNNISGVKLTIRQTIETAFQNVSYSYANFNYKNSEMSMFAIAVPAVCGDEESSGALFFILERINEPADIEPILKVFARVVSNLLSRQVECLRSRIAKKNEEHFADGHHQNLGRPPQNYQEVTE